MKKTYLIDMDGVLVEGQNAIPGAVDFIERLNATFRQRVSALTRRTRNLAQQAETLIAGMYLVGCFYNFF